MLTPFFISQSGPLCYSMHHYSSAAKEPTFCIFTQPNATMSQQPLKIITTISLQLKVTDATHRTEHISSNSCNSMSSSNMSKHTLDVSNPLVSLPIICSYKISKTFYYCSKFIEATNVESYAITHWWKMSEELRILFSIALWCWRRHITIKAFVVSCRSWSGFWT